eukprot:60135-Lingulodinium_polyedra.AAC.1
MLNFHEGSAEGEVHGIIDGRADGGPEIDDALFSRSFEPPLGRGILQNANAMFRRPMAFPWRGWPRGRVGPRSGSISFA